MKTFPALMLIVGIAIICSEANQICRCNHRLGVGGDSHTEKLTRECGKGYNCFVYIGYSYCEVGNSRSLLEACCNSYGAGGVKCME